jgi:glycerol kinase
MERQYVLAIDQGTTGTTVMVLDVQLPNRLQILGRSTVDFPQHFPKAGWVEHDLLEIRLSLERAIEQSLNIAQARKPDFSPQKLAAIGITNQRETICVFEPGTMKPLRPAMVWQCRRSTDLCHSLRKEGVEPMLRQKTGLLLDPYFSATKMRWLAEYEPDLMEAARTGRARFGTMDTYLLGLLTSGESYATEPSNASRTMLFNLATHDWDDDLLRLFKIPNRECLPTIRDSAAPFGKTKGFATLPDGIPITGMLGDQQAALYGQACFSPGQSKCTYGTGAFLLVNAGPKIPKPGNGVIATVAWTIQGKTTYALEGSVFVAGASLQFARDQLHLLQNVAESERLAFGKDAAPDIYFVPALTGLGAPHWIPEARGALLGLTRGTDQGQIIRAFLEGICLQVVDLIEVINDSLKADQSKSAVTELRVDGGASANNLLCQIQADLANLSVNRPHLIETTGFGAGLIACAGLDLTNRMTDLHSLRQIDKEFQPNRDAASEQKRTKILQGWRRAIAAVKAFAEPH